MQPSTGITAFTGTALRLGEAGEPNRALASASAPDFKSFKEFTKEFHEAAVGEFASGWAWLVQRKNGSLAIEKASNADDPHLVRNGQ